MPFMSAPNGGMPPLSGLVIVSGGKPSLNDAAPFVTLICEATGTSLRVPF
jgi:hypothetical protein